MAGAEGVPLASAPYRGAIPRESGCGKWRVPLTDAMARAW